MSTFTFSRRPLTGDGTFADNAAPIYGTSLYYVLDESFFITKLAHRQWMLRPAGASIRSTDEVVKQRVAAFYDAALHKAVFSRRCDAFEALQYVVGDDTHA